MKELNRDILTNAIQQLPSYTPDGLLWKRIEIDTAEEHNRETLEHTLRKLPNRTPLEALWENIEEVLDENTHTQENPALPQYTPPDFVWDRIEEELPKPEAKRVQMNRRFIFRIAGAAVVLLAIGYFSLFQSSSDELMYSVEWVNIEEPNLDGDLEGDEAFAMIEAICEDEPPACKEPEFQALKEELEFLSRSLDEIKEQIGTYDENVTLMAEVTEIELERNAIAKQMIDRLL